MAAQAKPARRRIVPEQIISPTKLPDEAAQTLPGPQLNLGDLKEHSALASELLGLGRKIHVDLAEYQKEQRPVDWKALLKERGVKRGKRAQAQQPDGDGPAGLPNGGLPVRTEPLNAFAAMIQKLERAVGMVHGEEEDSSDEDSIQDDMEASDDEDEGEAADKSGAAAGEGGGDGQRPAGQAGQSGASTRKREGGNDYDYCDDFIDDTEFIDMLEHSDRRKLKYEGFFICRGGIDRLEELVPEAIPDKPSRKRKAAAEGGVSGTDTGKKVGEGGEGPASKKTKKVDGIASPSGVQVLGGGAAGTPLTGARAPLPPYNMPQDTAEVIEQLRALAAAAPPPQPIVGPDGEEKAPRKQLPPAVLEHLKVSEHIFQRDYAEYKSNATKAILQSLYEFLESFASRETLRVYITGKTAPKKPKENVNSGVLSTDDLRALLERTVPPSAAEDAAEGSNQVGDQEGDGGAAAKAEAAKKWKAVPMTTRKAVYEYMKGRMGDNQLKSSAGQQIVAEALALFPPGTMDVSGVKTIFSQQRSKEQQAAKAAAEAAAGPSNAGAAAAPQQAQQQQAPAPAPTPAEAPAAAQPAGQPVSIAAIAAAAGAAAAAGIPAPAQPAVAAPAAPVQKQQAPAPAATPAATTSQQPSSSSRPGPADAEIIAAAKKHGATEAAVRDLLSECSGKYLPVLIRVLCLTGPEGMSVSNIAAKAVELKMESWDASSNAVKNGISRNISKFDGIAMLSGHKYALKLFPGVKDVRLSKEEPKPSKNNSGSGQTQQQQQNQDNGDNTDDDFVILVD